MTALRPGTQSLPTRGLHPATGEAASPRTQLDRTIDRGVNHLLSLQADAGYWWAELESNVTMASEHLLLEHFLGIGDAARWRKLERYILQHQGPDGGWPIYHGGPGDVSVSIEAYFALKLAGVDPHRPEMQAARQFIRGKGGVDRARVFTKVWLALFGQFEWTALPAMPPEAILLPAWFPINIYEFASWARATIVAILVVRAYQPVAPIPEHARVDELYLDPQHRRRIRYRRSEQVVSWRNALIALDSTLKALGRSPWKPLRERALSACERWIVEHQEADGSWGGIQPPWVYSLIALKCRGYSNDHPVVAKGIEGLLTEFALETEDTFTVQPCVSPVWDTALAVTALRECDVPADDPRLVQAATWLLDQEIRVPGDWCIKAPGVEPGGWAFEFHNERYPDVDDTAEVLIALRQVRTPRDTSAVVQRANRWLRGMQSNNGGWGAFDRNNSNSVVTQIPFADFGATIDPPSEDVTAHVLEWLMLDGCDRRDPAVRRSLRYLVRLQESDGSWFGRWGVNYVYGTGAVAPALVAAGAHPRGARLRRAVRWLEEHQNDDGGWGESCASYADRAMRGCGTSTASQTAWALLALLAAGEPSSPAVEQGVQYLVDHQADNGEWPEDDFTGTGFPRDFMLKYHLYRNYWPLWALGRYRRLLEGRPIHLPGTDPWS